MPSEGLRWGLGAAAFRAAGVALALLLGPASPAADAGAYNLATLFDWDLVSLEQNNPRFNASVLSGFHSLRSAGVAPSRAWKAGLGILFSEEEQVAAATNAELFSRRQLLANPKLAYGFYSAFEAGAGFEASYARGEIVGTGPGGEVVTSPEAEFAASAVDLGIKWSFLELGRLRLAASFDTRLAVNEDAYGALRRTTYNVEIDGDFAFTERFGLLSNIQYLTTNTFRENDQIVFDLGTTYSFSDRFRGMLFGTLQDEDEFDNVLVFAGVAGQYVFERHSFTLAFDFQLNDAKRDVRTQKQIDVELSYTITF